MVPTLEYLYVNTSSSRQTDDILLQSRPFEVDDSVQEHTFRLSIWFEELHIAYILLIETNWKNVTYFQGERMEHLLRRLSDPR